ncbi:MAG: MarC family protein [Methylovulum sp.]|nr:MarC family protein [Methylovulum sp.]
MPTIPDSCYVSRGHEQHVPTLQVCLLMAEKIADWLGTTGMNVITRVLGLIILSIAVEFITKGLAAVFPILAQPA